MNWLFREPRPDPRLGGALRRLEAASGVYDAQLRQRIVDAAAPALASLRAPTPRWCEWISRWVTVAVPVGLAASLAAGLLIPEAEEVAALGYSSEAAADSSLVLAAFSTTPEGGQLAAYLVAPQSGDLFEEALTQ